MAGIDPTNTPISVVIPALNEEELLGACLESLRAQECDFPFEIIVVDNSSTDATPAIARQYGARVIQEPTPGIARARAAGFAAARGSIIASTDADTVLPPYWLARIREQFLVNPDAVGIGGIWEYVDGPAAMRLAVNKVVNRLMPLIIRTAPWLWSFSGFNFAVRKKAYEACGGFNLDLRYGEDWDLGKRLRRVGRVIADLDLMVKTSGMAFVKDPLGIRAFLNYASLVCFGKTLLPVLMRRQSGRPRGHKHIPE